MATTTIPSGSATRSDRQLAALKSLAHRLADRLDLNASVRLWDNSVTPLGKNVTGPFEIRITGPGVVGSLLRWPTLDNVIRHYIAKGIDFSGGTLIDFGARFSGAKAPPKFRLPEVLGIFRALSPFLFEPADRTENSYGFEGDIIGHHRKAGDNTTYVQFHYDLSNEFYALFLDPEMVYSCAYFTDWTNDLARAQVDKLDMICRKLRLKPGDRFLDIGCGWGGLVCHAARHYGVSAHGVTLSEEQLAFARAKVSRLGLNDRITLDFMDYGELTGTFDKIASIGMYEHVGLKNIAAYMRTVRRLLGEDGLFLNHAIAHRALRPTWSDQRPRPEQKAIRKYIFPGGELDNVGHSIMAMERAGFEVHDVEAWRMHYARTTKLWCERLTAAREQAIPLVGEEKYRIWVAYLAGVSLAFTRGAMRIYQTLASKSAKRPPPLPPTRADLYR